MVKIKENVTCKDMSGAYLAATAVLSIATIGVGLYAYTNQDVETNYSKDVKVPEAKVKVDYIEKVRVISTGETEENNRFMAVIPATMSKNKKDMKSKMNPTQYERLKRFASDSERSSVTSVSVDMNSALGACALGLWGVSNVLYVEIDQSSTINPYIQQKEGTKSPSKVEILTFDPINRSYVLLVKSPKQGEHVSCILIDVGKQHIHLYESSIPMPNMFFKQIHYSINDPPITSDPKKQRNTPNAESKKNIDEALKSFANYTTILNHSESHKRYYPSETNVYSSGAWAVFFCLAFSKNKAGMASRNSATPFDYNKFVGDIDIKLFWEKVMEGFKLFGDAKEVDPPKKKKDDKKK